MTSTIRVASVLAQLVCTVSAGPVSMAALAPLPFFGRTAGSSSAPFAVFRTRRRPRTYVVAVRVKAMKPLDFTFFVPPGYGGKDLPNVRESNDPGQVFTVLFENGSLKWPDMRTGDLEINR